MAETLAVRKAVLSAAAEGICAVWEPVQALDSEHGAAGHTPHVVAVSEAVTWLSLHDFIDVMFYTEAKGEITLIPQSELAGVLSRPATWRPGGPDKANVSYEATDASLALMSGEALDKALSQL